MMVYKLKRYIPAVRFYLSTLFILLSINMFKIHIFLYESTCKKHSDGHRQCSQGHSFAMKRQEATRNGNPQDVVGEPAHNQILSDETNLIFNFEEVIFEE